MPSVQWGATNTAHFTFTPVSSALANLPNGAGTIAILWKPPTAATAQDGAGLTDSGNPAPTNWYHMISNGTGAKWTDDDGTGLVVVTTGAPNGTDWFITVVDWPAGGAALERFHSVDQTTAGAWVHSNSTGNNAGNRAGPGTGWFRVGYSGDFTMTSGTQIALVGAWAGVALGDTNAALLNANKKTSDWYSNPAGKPTFLCEVTSLTPSDLIGGSTFSSGNSTTTNLSVGGDPAGGWTFDGIGAVPAPAPRRMPLGL